jgi:hypothetical protein
MSPSPATSQAAFAAALLDPSLPCPGGVRTRSAADASRRFAIHRNNVVASLIDALGESFPVVRALVGDPFFRAMASVFVRLQPPCSPLLHAYGDGFATFVAGFAPSASLAYLADVAALEWARVEACHAADAEPPDAGAATQALGSGERAGDLVLQLHPSVRLVSSRHAVVSIWAAHQGQGALEEVDVDVGEHALVLRPDMAVLVVRCDTGTSAFVRSLQQGCKLGAGAALGATCPGFDLAACLSLLLAHGALVSIALPPEPSP